MYRVRRECQRERDLRAPSQELGRQALPRLRPLSVQQVPYEARARTPEWLPLPLPEKMLQVLEFPEPHRRTRVSPQIQARTAPAVFPPPAASRPRGSVRVPTVAARLPLLLAATQAGQH